MKRIILVVLLVSIAAFAGIVRSYSKTGRSISELPRVVSGDSDSQGDVRDEIRKSFELAAGARVQVEGINGAVKIETSDTHTAEITSSALRRALRHCSAARSSLKALRTVSRSGARRAMRDSSRGCSDLALQRKYISSFRGQ